MEEDAAQLRSRIQEHQDKLKAGNKDQEMTKEQQALLINNLERQLASLDNAWIVEQQRQQLVLKNKIAQRKEHLEKAKKLRATIEQKEAA